jgi:hypothetical protein
VIFFIPYPQTIRAGRQQTVAGTCGTPAPAAAKPCVIEVEASTINPLNSRSWAANKTGSRHKGKGKREKGKAKRKGRESLCKGEAIRSDPIQPKFYRKERTAVSTFANSHARKLPQGRAGQGRRTKYRVSKPDPLCACVPGPKPQAPGPTQKRQVYAQALL